MFRAGRGLILATNYKYYVGHYLHRQCVHVGQAMLGRAKKTKVRRSFPQVSYVVLYYTRIIGIFLFFSKMGSKGLSRRVNPKKGDFQDVPNYPSKLGSQEA